MRTTCRCFSPRSGIRRVLTITDMDERIEDHFYAVNGLNRAASQNHKRRDDRYALATDRPTYVYSYANPQPASQSTTPLSNCASHHSQSHIFQTRYSSRARLSMPFVVLSPRREMPWMKYNSMSRMCTMRFTTPLAGTFRDLVGNLRHPCSLRLDTDAAYSNQRADH